MTTKVEIDVLSHRYIDDSKEALIPPLEFTLVKDLDGDNR
jgi:hypothetical protein